MLDTRGYWRHTNLIAAGGESTWPRQTNVVPMSFLMLMTGLAVLVFAGDYFVKGAVSLAVRLSVPILVIGLTVVAFGTSAPELVVSMEAALTGSPGLAIGNVIGSNIANVLLVLGLPAIFTATNCNQPFIRSNLAYVILASLVFVAFTLTGTLQFWHGAILFALLVAFLVMSAYQTARPGATHAAAQEVEEIAGDNVSAWSTTAFIAIGIIGLPAGAHLTVMGATGLAEQMGVSNAAVGLTIVAFGTSLPELITTLLAAYRGHSGPRTGQRARLERVQSAGHHGTDGHGDAGAGARGHVARRHLGHAGCDADHGALYFPAYLHFPRPGRRFVAGYLAYVLMVYAPRSEHTLTGPVTAGTPEVGIETIGASAGGHLPTSATRGQ